MNLIIASVAINIILALALLGIIFILLLPVVLGAPYLPTPEAAVKKMVELARIVPGEKAADLGSGDGRIVIALAQAGAEAHGYEVNPFLVWLSRRRIRRAGLNGQAFVHWQSFRRMSFTSFQVVTVYGLASIMQELESKLQKELPKDGRVISYIFSFPNWPVSKNEESVRRYEKFHS